MTPETTASAAESYNRSIFPKQYHILSGSALKMIAIITMFIDHYGAHYLRGKQFAMNTLFLFAGNQYSLYRISRDIGRIAFPIFVFLIAEGCMHTHNKLLYARNLFFFALISEIPWNYIHSGNLRYAKQNVYFTLLLGYLGMCVIDYYHENQALQFTGLAVLLAISYYLNADYGWKGYIFCLIMYLLRYEGAAQAVVGSCWLYFEWKACFAFLPINAYNGKRGFIKGRIKYLFYAFYPVHLMILGLVKYNFSK